MSLAITPSTSSACSTGCGPAPQPSGLDADLAKAQSELADWVHCPSSKTPEGKANIEEVSAKVDAIKIKLKKADEGSPLMAKPAAKPSAEQAQDARNEVQQQGHAAPPALLFSGLGSYLDAYA